MFNQWGMDWKQIGFGGYQVSDTGLVKNSQGVILQAKKDRDGYLYVRVYKNGVRKNHYVHRLVAYAFLPNPFCYQTVNHKDENKTNNTAGNLEWCNEAYNLAYGTRNKRSAEKRSKPVAQYTTDGKLLKTYKSVTDAAKQNNYNIGGISRCANGIRKQMYGYVWRYI